MATITRRASMWGARLASDDVNDWNAGLHVLQYDG